MYVTVHFWRVLLLLVSLIVKTIFFFEVPIYRFLSYIFMSSKYLPGFVNGDQILHYEVITPRWWGPWTLSGDSPSVIFSAVVLRCLITYLGSLIASAAGLVWLVKWWEVIVWQRDLNLDERILKALWLRSSFIIWYFLRSLILARSTCLTYNIDFIRRIFRALGIMGLETFILITQTKSL